MDYSEREIVVISRIVLWLWLGTIVFVTPALNAEELGRLFFNGAERKAMNEKRLPPKLKPIASVTQKESAEPKVKASAEVSESVRIPDPKITGKVIRSSGNNTVWLNRYPQYERAKRHGAVD